MRRYGDGIEFAVGGARSANFLTSHEHTSPMSSAAISASSKPAARPRVLTLAWTLLVELCLTVAIGVIGTALAARISDTSGAAFSIANQISVTLFLLFRIIGSGIGVVVTQNLGSGRRAVANQVALAMLGASTWLGVVTAWPARAGIAHAGAGHAVRRLECLDGRRHARAPAHARHLAGAGRDAHLPSDAG